jgi:hypothetical protein
MCPRVLLAFVWICASREQASRLDHVEQAARLDSGCAGEPSPCSTDQPRAGEPPGPRRAGGSPGLRLRSRLARESLHSSWATRIADDLNDRWPPAEFVAAEFTELHGRLEVDVTTYENAGPSATDASGGVATAARPKTWSPPPPTHAVAAVLPASLEIRVLQTVEGNRVGGVIELVSPSNKDRPSERQAFIAKCAGFLANGASLVIVDIVTEKHFNLHNELARLLELGADVAIPEETTFTPSRTAQSCATAGPRSTSGPTCSPSASLSRPFPFDSSRTRSWPSSWNRPTPKPVGDGS